MFSQPHRRKAQGCGGKDFAEWDVGLHIQGLL